MSTTINLRDFYPWYIQDEFVEVSDEIAAELTADKNYHKAHDRRMRRNKAYSLDFDTDMEAAALVLINDNPEAIFAMKERYCQLCQALNSLPEAQGRRVEAHYILGKSRKEIAKAEGVSEEAVNKSITKGLAVMKKYFQYFEKGGCFSCPK